MKKQNFTDVDNIQNPPLTLYYLSKQNNNIIFSSTNNAMHSIGFLETFFVLLNNLQLWPIVYMSMLYYYKINGSNMRC